MKASEIDQILTGLRLRFESSLQQRIPAANADPALLHRAMRYSALSGGKRIRPLLTYASGRVFQVEPEQLDALACAVELIHAYSLIHDDLPAMDDDDLRRGQATCHLEFGEATAILAGDALQALAFQTLASGFRQDPGKALQLIEMLAAACGSSGMAGGQMLDLEATGDVIELHHLEHIHALKTGALIRTSVLAPAILSDADTEIIRCLETFGDCVGLGFQIRDDILDVIGNTAETGKSAHTDEERHKPTFPSLIGLKSSQIRASELRDESLACLDKIPGDTTLLARLAEYMISRDR